jgi:hypothetical protein
VTITGAGFGGGLEVFFGDTPAQDITSVSNTKITAVSPPEPSGQPATVNVTVSCSGVVSPTVAADEFSYSVAVPSPATSPPSSVTSSAGQ